MTGSGFLSQERQDEEIDAREVGRGRDFDDEPASENTPLLQAGEVEHRQHGEGHDREEEPPKASAFSLSRYLSGANGKRRWPSLAALAMLCVGTALIIVFAFVAPSAVEQYAAEAVVFEPTSLSVDSITEFGVRARIQGMFQIDSSRVQKPTVRGLGKFCTWIATEVETGDSQMAVSLPEYGNVLLGTAQIPPIKVYIRDQHITAIDFVADLRPGDVEGIRRIATDYIEGRLGQLRVVGTAHVPLRSGLLNLGKQTLRQEMLFDNKDIPDIPAYDIKKLNFREVQIPSGKGMAADVSIHVQNKFPVDFTVPPLGFGILVENCKKDDPYIMLGDALTDRIHIQPKTDLDVNVTGTVRHLPPVLTQDCPGTTKSPLDVFVGHYIHGETNTVYVRGSDSPSPDTPEWVTALIRGITVPVPVPGRTFGHLIKNFSLTDTHFSLPEPWAEPDTPESNPRITANVRALIALPEEMNFSIDVGKVRADADVFYKGNKLGRLDLSKWQKANSTRLDGPNKDEDGPTLMVESKVKEAPLEIQDEDVFTDVIQALLFGGKGVTLTIKAQVDVGVETALGEFAIRKIPAEGSVPIKPFTRPRPSDPDHPPPKHGKDLFGSVDPKIVDLNIVNTTKTSLTIDAAANITNPTVYSATIPYIDINIIKNGSLLGHATARNLSITPGRNCNLRVSALYAPLDLGGHAAKNIGRELISQYISGWNTTITLQMHERSIPGNPKLSRALSRFPIEVAAPHITPKPSPSDPSDPDDGDGDDEDRDPSPHFIRDATMHLLSSSATFLLLSPLQHSTLVITDLNATALYRPSPDEDFEEVGKIIYDLPLAVPPVKETPEHAGYLTPRLPVDWSFGSVGYGAVKRALGGSLKLNARAEVGVRLGRWTERVWFVGGGLGVRIRL